MRRQKADQSSLPAFFITLAALLSGARTYRKADLAREIYERMKSLFPHARSDLIAASILACNTVGAIGDYDQLRTIRNDRIERFGGKVSPGITQTEVNGEIEVGIHLGHNIIHIHHALVVCVAGVHGKRQLAST